MSVRDCTTVCVSVHVCVHACNMCMSVSVARCCTGVCMSPTQQHVEQPGVEVAGASGLLARADGRAGRRASDGGRADLQVGHKRLQQHLKHAHTRVLSQWKQPPS